MQVLGLPKLDAAKRAHADSRGQFDAWLQEARAASWATPQDVKERFSSASFLADNRVVFNIKGNAYRLVVKINYPSGIVLIEWAGTHAEYDRETF